MALFRFAPRADGIRPRVRNRMWVKGISLPTAKWTFNCPPKVLYLASYLSEAWTARIPAQLSPSRMKNGKAASRSF